ncbi:MAG: GatB/YqeY domain-containing protein [Rhodanobacteraceae bacterium]|nr:GatB/YqeY domain-containing protein [Rhodanobacteraceae bacterium]
MSLKLQLTDDMKAAMKGGEKDKLLVIRLINAAIKQREVDERIQLDDTQVLAVLEKMVKQRKDSITQYEAAAREDLAQVERYELGVIQVYLPAQMAAEEVEAIVVAAIAESGATSAKDMGKVIALVKPKVAGRTDMGKGRNW